MSRIEVAAAETSHDARLVSAFGDPLRGAGPATCTGELTDLAARVGIERITLKLGHGYLRNWREDAQALHHGSLASRRLAEHPHQVSRQ